MHVAMPSQVATGVLTLLTTFHHSHEHLHKAVAAHGQGAMAGVFLRTGKGSLPLLACAP